MIKLSNRAMHRVHRFWHKDLFNYYYDQKLRKKVFYHNSWLDKFRRKHMMTCQYDDVSKYNWMSEFWFWVCDNLIEKYIYWSGYKLRDREDY